MHKQVKALIVDDEPLGRDNLRLALGGRANWAVQDSCASVAAARAALRADDAIDVVFLDVQMPEESGMVLARELAELAMPPVIVFVTAYQHYAIQAFDLHALDYLLKPFDEERFAQALNRVESLLDWRRPGDAYRDALAGCVGQLNPTVGATVPRYPATLSVRSTGQIEAVAVDQLHWVCSSGNYVELHLAHRMVLHRSTLSDLAERLDPAIFMRVHRRALVRCQLCASLRVIGDGTYQLKLFDGTAIAVSERHAQQVKAWLDRQDV